VNEATCSPSDRSKRLEHVIGEYLDAIQSGRPFDRDGWLAAHADLGDELRAFLADYDEFQNLAAPLRDVAVAAAGAASTASHECAGISAGCAQSAERTSEGGGSSAPLAGTRVRYFGDYELLRTLGEGGMGIVFEARQRSLNRIVALKMIRAGRFAVDDDLRRFRNEAEAVARLDHPHIVPVYEVGEHEGHHYFSMKRIDGASLASRLDEFGDRPREAARLVLTVAQALHHAHQRGVLHRDVKPSNIVLDAKGEPHLTDFGLAKRVEGPGAAETTRSGAILGTPAYMAPEQASAQRGEVTTATDVYGMGAVLYALLTGHAPFRGESVADTLVQVREGSPEPIRRSKPKLSRDLETICLRCLAKDPRRRYASADALAEELGRWLRGEPIVARPVGRLERGWMWCSRNPLVASLIASIAAALFVGTTVSTVFALRASNRARAERKERIRAENAETDAKNARDQIEATLARSLIRPLDPEAEYEEKDVLPPIETDAFWELAGNGSGSLGLRYLHEATRDPMSTRQLCARSEPAMIAAVGLNEEKRRQAIDLLMGRLAETGMSLTQKADITLALLELDDRSAADSRACEQIWADAMESSVPEQLLSTWNRDLIQSVDRMRPEMAARLLLVALERHPTSGMHFSEGYLGEALQMVSGRLAPPDAVAVRNQAVRILAGTIALKRYDSMRGYLAGEFAAAAARTPPAAAARALKEAFERATDDEARVRAAISLAHLVDLMHGNLAADILPLAVGPLADALVRQPAENLRHEVAWALAVLAKSWQGPGIADALRPAVQQLAAALKAETNPDRRGDLAWALAPLAERLGPEEASPVWLSAAESLSSDQAKTWKIGPRSWIRGTGALVIRLPRHMAVRTNPPSRGSRGIA
jgi:serine/threonine protein kinase